VHTRHPSGPVPRRLTARLAALSLVAAGAVVAAVTTAGPAEAVTPAAPACGPAATTTSFTRHAALTIPETGLSLNGSALVVSGAGSYLTDVDVITRIRHSFPADLDMTLRSPLGTVVTLSTDNGNSADDAFNGTRWDDDANPAGQVPYTNNDGMVTDRHFTANGPVATLTPEEPLGAFIGENPNGTWTLAISDDTNNDGGALDEWSLDLATLPGPPSGWCRRGRASLPTP
jgi:subtilisin-like proprotein convertase family protein